MLFAKKLEDQLQALQIRFPEKNYTLEMYPEVIIQAYREEFIKPVLLQLIDRKICKTGRPYAEQYEDACATILEWTIGQEFDMPIVHHPRTLQIEGKPVRIRDMTLSVPQDEIPNGWRSLRKEHKLRSIVFECKNYTHTTKISRKEIFQLYEYLNPKSYGKLGIILSRYGKKSLSSAANLAIERISHDDYRIIILSDDDMVEMISEFIETGSCNRFFNKHNDDARTQES